LTALLGMLAERSGAGVGVAGGVAAPDATDDEQAATASAVTARRKVVDASPRGRTADAVIGASLRRTV
jgi:hypothetical protein